MGKRGFIRTAFVLLLCGMLFIPAWCSASAVDADSAQDQRKYRIGYIEGGSYWRFAETLEQAQNALSKEGWLNRIDFPVDAHFSPGWGDNLAALQKDGAELMNRRDIDLVISAGTDATQAMLAVNNGHIPIVGMCITDPIASGIVKSRSDSGVDNFTVCYEANAYKRLFRVFHAAVDFHKLGLMYSSSKNGKLYTNYAEAHAIARERGFEVVDYAKVGVEETEAECLAGIQWLVGQGIDAFYISSLSCFDYSLHPQSSQRLLAYLMENKIPTLAKEGTIGVRSGALMGFSNMDLAGVGHFLAKMIIRILEGEKPRSIPMVVTLPPSLSFNLYTASKIGFYPSFDILTSCDIVFREISIPPCPTPE